MMSAKRYSQLMIRIKTGILVKADNFIPTNDVISILFFLNIFPLDTLEKSIKD